MDATEYYAPNEKHPEKKRMLKHGASTLVTEELKAECYIGFSKLLNEELKTFDLKDAVIFDLRSPSNSP